MLVLAISAVAVYALNMKSNDQIVATINGTPVMESEITDKLTELSSAKFIDKSFSYENLTPEMKKNIIKSIIVGRLLDKKADEAKIQDSAEFKKALAVEIEQMKQKIFLDQKTREVVTSQVIKEKYEAFVKEKENKEEIKVVHMIFADEQAAKDAAAKLSLGENFEAVMKENNDKNKDNNNGGELDFFTKEQMPESFSQAAFALEKDQVSAPVKTEFGWHIIKLLDKRKVKIPSYEEMAPRLESELFQKYIQDYIENLITENKVEITLK